MTTLTDPIWRVTLTHPDGAKSLHAFDTADEAEDWAARCDGDYATEIEALPLVRFVCRTEALTKAARIATLARLRAAEEDWQLAHLEITEVRNIIPARFLIAGRAWQYTGTEFPIAGEAILALDDMACSAGQWDWAIHLHRLDTASAFDGIVDVPHQGGSNDPSGMR